MPLRSFAWSGGLATSGVAAGAYGVGWIAPSADADDSSLLSFLRNQPTAVLSARLLVLFGVVVLAATWLLLGRRLRSGSVTRTRDVVRLSLWWGAPLVVAPVLFSRDVFSYIAQSRLLPMGIDPYLHGPGMLASYLGDGADPLWRSVPTPYGPGWIAASSVVFRLTNAEAIPALLGFRMLAVAGVALIAIFLPRLAATCGADRPTAVWIGLLNPLVLLHLLSAAHNDALMIGLLVAGVALAMEDHAIGALLLVSVAAALKVPALIAVPFVGLAWADHGATRWVSIRRLTLAALIPLGVFTSLDVVTGVGFGWISNIGAPDRVRMWLSPTTALGMTLGHLAGLLGLGDRSATDVAVVRRVGTVAAMVVVGWLLVTWRRRSVARNVGVSLIGIAVLAPVVQPWYLLWGLVVLAGAGLRAAELRAAALVTTVLVLYSIVNTNATSVVRLTLKDPPAAALSVGLGIALVLASRLAGQIRVRRDVA